MEHLAIVIYILYIIFINSVVKHILLLYIYISFMAPKSKWCISVFGQLELLVPRESLLPHCWRVVSGVPVRLIVFEIEYLKIERVLGCGVGRFFRIPTPDSSSFENPTPTPAILKKATPTPAENMRLHRLLTPTPQPLLSQLWLVLDTYS